MSPTRLEWAESQYRTALAHYVEAQIEDAAERRGLMPARILELVDAGRLEVGPDGKVPSDQLEHAIDDIIERHPHAGAAAPPKRSLEENLEGVKQRVGIE